jgi:magnesium transporter
MKRLIGRMWRRVPKVQVGAPPGTLRTSPDALPPSIRVMAFSQESLTEAQLESPEEIQSYLDKWPVTWINVDGLGDEQTLRRIAELFGIHQLALEDVVNVPQRPKLEQYDEHCSFIVSRMVTSQHGLGSEQLSLFVGGNWVLTFQETSGDCFDPVRQRIRTGGGGRIRKSSPDYLAYALLDAVIDAYYPVLEEFGERLEQIEDDVLTRPKRASIQQIHHARRDLLVLRRALWPQREMLNSLVRDEVPQISDSTRVYLRDCYDHMVQMMDLVETDREMVGGLRDAYMSGLSNRMNEVMKVLTIIATIFIPLGFIAGLYGMNFDPALSQWNMPELSWRYGYLYALGLMAAVALAMLWVFYRLGWLGGRDSVAPDDQEKSDAQ